MKSSLAAWVIGGAASWAFVLEPLDGGRTRLVERFRVRFEGPAPAFRVIGPIMGFGVFMMVRRQLLGIRERAELTAVAPRLERAAVKRSEAKPCSRSLWCWGESGKNEPAGTKTPTSPPKSSRIPATPVTPKPGMTSPSAPELSTRIGGPPGREASGPLLGRCRRLGLDGD